MCRHSKSALKSFLKASGHAFNCLLVDCMSETCAYAWLTFQTMQLQRRRDNQFENEVKVYNFTLATFYRREAEKWDFLLFLSTSENVIKLPN